MKAKLLLFYCFVWI